ncbi:hypothetical protein [Flavisolibacter ginsenosidimutans]|uniref:Uncharacterized protein n=1 Tax=Flavisolibacter ginsenosidimutans TaxID=661481 RepID=A0A5B8UJ37_9BACT|nr:hypothetical protein [Flavisolibacter ginsenosidimutans]QEC56412.1 hypothetical protein FSB75_11085 [Flavisolibacter ginsenosidimutans]
MRKLLFLSGLALWIFSCNGKDNGSGQSPATDTTVNVTNSTPNNATGTGASNMGGDTGTINGTPNNQTMTNSGATGGNNMNSSGTTTTNRADTSMNHGGQKKSSQRQ